METFHQELLTILKKCFLGIYISEWVMDKCLQNLLGKYPPFSKGLTLYGSILIIYEDSSLLLCKSIKEILFVNHIDPKLPPFTSISELSLL